MLFRSLEISVQDNCIILRKAETADIFNGSTEDLVEFEGRKVSKESIRRLAKIAGMTIVEAV